MIQLRFSKCILLLVLCVQSLFAQVPAQLNAAEIFEEFKKLNVLGSVLYVAAHPDDENTRLLAYLAKEKKYRTGYLSLTRGDGGQNLIGVEQGIELGLIRTQELIAARRIDGAEQFFSRAFDFGYSKTARETLHTWDSLKVLSDVVWIIRKFKPDVIITRFPADNRAGHGHHWSSAVLANIAFKAAADPNQFTDHFKYGLQPWSAKRILWNTFNFGGNNTIANDQFKVEVGQYNAVLGKGYGEVASESRSQHKSQGFGVARQRGQSFEYFVTTGGVAPKTDLMDDVITDWRRVEGSEKIQTAIQQLIHGYQLQNPIKSLPQLIQLKHLINQLPISDWRNQKLNSVNFLIEQCAGLFLDAFTNQPHLVVGDSLQINFVANSRVEGTQIKLNRIGVVMNYLGDEEVIADAAIEKSLVLNNNSNHVIKLNKTAAFKATQPYWLAGGEPNGVFQIPSPHLIGQPENTPMFRGLFNVTIDGADFIFEKPIRYKYTDPVKGELYQPFNIINKVSFQLSHQVIDKHANLPFSIHISPEYNSSKAIVQVQVQQNGSWETIAVDTFQFKKNVELLMSVPQKRFQSFNQKTIPIRLNVQDESGEHVYAYATKLINYDHIPTIQYQSLQQVKLIHQPIKISSKKIGYIVGAGDKVPEALMLMGYSVEVLQEAQLQPKVLQQFDAIITGVRAYNVHSYLPNYNQVIMQYIQNGGNFIVQYNTNNQFGGVKDQIGPFSFNITRTRVTEENANVKFLLPNHPVLNYPNKIQAADFEGWVQERSIYQADNPPAPFVTPLEMNDENENPSNGSLIIAPYGKGNFVYTGLVFFRQLPAGVDGAYKLMANLIALPKNK